jgi:hypothetical protein
MKNKKAVQKATVSEKALTPVQVKMIAALLDDGNVQAAAQSAGVSRSTFYRWLDDCPAFKIELDRGRRALFSEALSRLAGATARAVDVLTEAMSGRNTAERGRAAGRVLDLALRIAEFEQLDARLAALEEASGVQVGGPPIMVMSRPRPK